MPADRQRGIDPVAGRRPRDRPVLSCCLMATVRFSSGDRRDVRSAGIRAVLMTAKQQIHGLRSVAQLVEHRSPKPGVGGSSPYRPCQLGSGVGHCRSPDRWVQWPAIEAAVRTRRRGERSYVSAFGKIRFGRISVRKFGNDQSVQDFMQQVAPGAAKVTWPSRRETTITTAMVFVFACIASAFFLRRRHSDPLRRERISHDFLR